MSNDILNIH